MKPNKWRVEPVAKSIQSFQKERGCVKVLTSFLLLSMIIIIIIQTYEHSMTNKDCYDLLAMDTQRYSYVWQSFEFHELQAISKPLEALSWRIVQGAKRSLSAHTVCPLIILPNSFYGTIKLYSFQVYIYNAPVIKIYQKLSKKIKWMQCIIWWCICTENIRQRMNDQT